MAYSPTYEDLKKQTLLTLESASNSGGAAWYQVHAARATAFAILTLAEALRPQPDVVNVTVTDAIVTKIKEV